MVADDTDNAGITINPAVFERDGSRRLFQRGDVCNAFRCLNASAFRLLEDGVPSRAQD